MSQLTAHNQPTTTAAMAEGMKTMTITQIQRRIQSHLAKCKSLRDRAPDDRRMALAQGNVDACHLFLALLAEHVKSKRRKEQATNAD